MPYKDNCFHSYVDNDLSNYRQFAALTTLPRKTRSTQKESFNRLAKDKGELKLQDRFSIDIPTTSN